MPKPQCKVIYHHKLQKKQPKKKKKHSDKKYYKDTCGFLIICLKIEWRVNRSSLNKTAVWAGAVTFNQPSIVTCPVCKANHN